MNYVRPSTTSIVADAFTQAWLSNFVDNAIDLPWRNLSPEFGTKFQREVPLFLDVPEFP